MTRQEALTLLNEYVKNPALINHALMVEAAMKHYAAKQNEDIDQWSIAGLLHDFDYERWPDPPDHTREGAKILRERGVDDEIIGAIMAHADSNLDEYPRNTPIRKTLFAVDELCGFIHAVGLVRPEGIHGMMAKSVTKKLKTKAFAAAVSREDIQQGAELMGLPLNEHIEECIAACTPIADQVGLQGKEAG
jgi:putative nucleotidyltransferase with HDIG domain